MQSDVKKAGKNTKAIAIYAGMAAISLALVWLITRTSACVSTSNWLDDIATRLMPAPTGWQHYLGIFDSRLSCLRLNELGDFLAGVFAPIAFAALAISVFIQSRELNETQNVMRAQLSVSIQQVEETKKSTALFEKQTKILQEDREIRQRHHSDQIFAASAEAFRKFLLRSNNLLLKSKAPHQQSWHPINLLVDFADDAELDSITFHLSQALSKIIRDIESPNAIMLYSQNRQGMARLSSGIEHLNRLLPYVSPAMRIKESTYGLDILRERLEELLRKVPETTDNL